MSEFKIKVNGNEYKVNISNVEGDVAQVEVNGTSYKVEVEGGLKQRPAKAARPVVAPVKVAAPVAQVSKPAAAAGGGAGAIQSPLPGIIVDISVNVGDTVKQGQKVLVLEAMKMENNINADRDGKVVEIKVKKGDSVLEGATLIVLG